jgi:Fanconi anemia group M protein
MLGNDSARYVEHPLVRSRTVEFRLYQKNIAEKVCKQNTLVILPTALGKTVISALATANTLYNYRSKRVLMMAPTRPLVMQHLESFMKVLKLGAEDVSMLTGKTPADCRAAVWGGKARVIFATPQVVRNDLLEGRLSLENFGLLIFDECHRSVKNYAYTEISRKYIAESPYPLILGTTASPGSDPKRVKAVCDALFIERVEYRSEEDADVRPYIHPIDMEWRRVSLPEEYAALAEPINLMLNSKLEWLRSHGIIRRRAEHVTRGYLLDVGEELRYRLEETPDEGRGTIYAAIVNQSLAITLFHALELLESQGVHSLKAFLERVESQRSEKRSYAHLLRDPAYLRLGRALNACEIDHPKLGSLKQHIEGQLAKNPSSKILVFTQYRDTASHLVRQLNGLTGARVERFVGQASRLDDEGLTQDEQAERLKRFKGGLTNVLVATSIAEEGLDIPSVDFVIFYEPVPSEIRYIQRRGRTGRWAPGKVVILAADSKFDLAYLYASKRKVQRMREVAQSLNQELKQILRMGAMPEPDRMSPEELKLREEGTAGEPIPAPVKIEEEKIRELNRGVERAKRSLYLKLLEAGPPGAGVERLTSDLEAEGYQLPVVSAALGNLEREGQALRLGERVTLTARKLPSEKTYDVTVERILSGGAVVWVDGKWRARLAAEDYDGPMKVMKKNSRFRAVGELYHMDNVLCLRVSQVIQTISPSR